MLHRRRPLQCGRALALFLSFATFVKGEKLSSMTPCAYPMLNDTAQCGIDDPTLRQRVRVCDPDKAISMSEVEAITEKLEDIYVQKEKFCVCEHDQARPCFYRFGFAFLRHLLPVDDGVTQRRYSGTYCPANETFLRLAKSRAAPLNPKEMQEYGDTFAGLVRERWHMDMCEDDILFLVLLRRPEQLGTRSMQFTAQTSTAPRASSPYVFASVGKLVLQKIEALEPNEQDFSQHVDPLQRIVHEENENLQNGYPLKAVSERLLERFTQTLSRAEEIITVPRSRAHIPNWAIAVFLACGFLCVLMAFGLCLMRTSVRRGSQRGKPMDTSRRWKAGFVGETLEGVPTGGVNLMQMMLSPPSARNINNVNIN